MSNPSSGNMEAVKLLLAAAADNLHVVVHCRTKRLTALQIAKKLCADVGFNEAISAEQSSCNCCSEERVWWAEEGAKRKEFGQTFLLEERSVSWVKIAPGVWCVLRVGGM